MLTAKEQLFNLLDEYKERNEVRDINLLEDFYPIKGKICQRVIKNNKMVGFMVALDKSHIGFSFCNPIDKFDKDYSKKLAFYRAKQGKNPWKTIPESYYSDLTHFTDRVRRYFKSPTVPATPALPLTEDEVPF